MNISLTGSRFFDLSDNVGHASLVTQKGSKLARLIRVILGERLH
jgi:hypothetical protein